MLSDVDQPRQPGMRIDLEHPDARLEPQPFSQRAHGPHQYIGWHTLAMQQWAVRLLEITRLQAVAMVSHRDVRRREDCLVPSSRNRHSPDRDSIAAACPLVRRLHYLLKDHQTIVLDFPSTTASPVHNGVAKKFAVSP